MHVGLATAAALPFLFDADDDGDIDLYLSNNEGNIFYYRNIVLTSYIEQTTRGSNPFDLGFIGTFASPAAFDADDDGDIDIFVGRSDGKVMYFKNTGDSNNPSFVKSFFRHLQHYTFCHWPIC